MLDAAAPSENSAPAGWWVQVRGQAYGPYSLEQISQFVAEGRVRPATLVAPNRDGGWTEARSVDGLMGTFRTTPHAPTPANSSVAEAANVFIHAEIHSGAWTGFMAALESMGMIADLAPGLWLLRTRFSAGIIRNTLSQTLERGDRFVVIDATRDRLAWFNLGPEVDVHIKDVWNGALRPETRKL